MMRRRNKQGLHRDGALEVATYQSNFLKSDRLRREELKKHGPPPHKSPKMKRSRKPDAPRGGWRKISTFVSGSPLRVQDVNVDCCREQEDATHQGCRASDGAVKAKTLYSSGEGPKTICQRHRMKNRCDEIDED